MKIGLIDAKNIDVAQPIWLSGCPMKVHFRAFRLQTRTHDQMIQSMIKLFLNYS